MKSFLFDLNKGPFFDDWERLAGDKQQLQQRKRLLEYLDFSIKHVPFYENQLAGINKKDPNPLLKIPPLTSANLRELLPPKKAALLAYNTGAYTVFQSGGTTGFPKTSLFSHDELEGLNFPNSRGFYALGLKKEDRVANLFAVGGLYMTFIHINRMLQQFGCMNFPFSNHTAADFILSITKLFNINCFTGIASVVLSVLRDFQKSDFSGLKIDKIFYAGEHLYSADREDLKNKFNVTSIGSPGYGTVETWYIGYQCSHCPPDIFHAHNDLCYIEIVNDDFTQEMEKEEPGFILVTPFPRRLTPIVRYFVGDRAKWLTSSCPCGRTTPLFKLLGRGDDMLRIGFDSISYDYVQEKIAEVPNLTGTVQIEKSRINGRDCLIIRVESPLAIDKNLIEKNLSESIKNGKPSLREAIKNESVLPIKVSLVPIGSLAKNPRTGKLIRIIDSIKDED